MALICPQCSQENNDQSVFCSRCGFRFLPAEGAVPLNNTGSAPAPAPAPNAGYAGYPAQANPPEPVRHKHMDHHSLHRLWSQHFTPCNRAVPLTSNRVHQPMVRRRGMIPMEGREVSISNNNKYPFRICNLRRGNMQVQDAGSTGTLCRSRHATPTGTAVLRPWWTT